MNSKPCAEKSFPVQQYSRESNVTRDDVVAVEEPMEIRLTYGSESKSGSESKIGSHRKKVMRQISVTMRTPGHDEGLAAGFLYSEGVLTSSEQIDEIVVSGVDGHGKATDNIVRVDINSDVDFDDSRLQRNFFSNSSCGVCGKTSIESLDVKGIRPLEKIAAKLHAAIIYELPNSLRSIQPTFERTGGIHAAGFAKFDGEIGDVREDIGRHNAVDKLIGALFLRNELPATELIMVVSGRASFEIVQKAIVARVPVMVAVGAPSSLAVELASKYKMALIGFASESRFNVYTDENNVIN